jgi:hypothetical protein
MAGHDKDRDFRAKTRKAGNSSSAPQGFVIWVGCYDNEFLWRHHEWPIVSQAYAKIASPVCRAAFLTVWRMRRSSGTTAFPKSRRNACDASDIERFGLFKSGLLGLRRGALPPEAIPVRE